jgi:uncharacterized protein YyaL (SSP411 family)
LPVADGPAVRGADAPAFKRAYDVTRDGNWEGHTILHRVTPDGSPEEEAALALGRDALFRARARRVRPGRDDKVLADWNGLAVAALARAAMVFGHPEWLTRAQETFDFVLAEMGAPDGRVQHAWRLRRVTAAGLLDDQAAMARAGLALYEATGDAQGLAQAIRIMRATEERFTDGHGGFYTTADDATDVPLARPRTAADNATPAGAGIIAEVHARLFHLTGDAAWREHAEATLRAFTDVERISGMPGILAAADLLEEAATVVVAGDPADSRTIALTHAALCAPDPAVAVLRAPQPDALPAGHPAHGKGTVGGAPAAYLCRRNVCGLPITDAATLTRSLDART